MPENEVTVTCVVTASVEDAFTMFTEQIDRWWVRSPHAVPDTVVRFERDRLLAATPEGAELLATVTAWDPPARLEMEWNGPHAQPGDTVVVEFQPEAHGTRVTVHHRRTGLRPQEATAAVLGLWWGDLLYRLARNATNR